MKIKKTLLFSIIIFSLFSSLFSVNVLGITPNINYTFDNDVIFDDTIDSYNQPYNLRYQSEYTGLYNATYSFTNDIVGNEPDGFELSTSSNIFGFIIENLEGHNKVVNLTDNSNIARFFLRNTFNNISFGIVEFWFRLTDKTKDTEVRITKSTENSIRIFLNNLDVIDDTWFHYKIQFATNTNLYTHWLNNQLIASDIGFDFNSDIIDNIIFIGNTAQEGYSCFIDAIGYSFGEKFDFENDLIGSEPLGWNVQSFGSGIATVERFQESNVFKIFDDSIHESVDISTSFTQLSNRTIEYYIAINDTSLAGAYNMIFTEGGSGRISLVIDNDDLDYHGGVIQTSVKDDFIIENIWFKITIVLQDYTNTFDIYIDDILEGNDLNYTSNSTISIDGLVFASDGVQEIITYLDNFIFYSINFIDYNYSIGQNLIPFLNTSQTLQEVDKYEFALNDIHTFNAGGSKNPNGWNSLESGGGIAIIFPEFDSSYDRLVLIQGSSISDLAGLEKDDFTISGNFISVSLGVFFTIMDGGVNDAFTFIITSSDNSLILSFSIRANLSVWYQDGAIERNANRDIVLGSNNRYDFNFLLNYELDLIFFTYSLNDVIQEIFIFEMFTLNKEGLKKINYRTVLNTNNDMKSYIDYIGIYANGISQVDKGVDFGIALIKINNAWNFEQYNLFTFGGVGTFHLGASPTGYFEGFPFDIIKDTTVYSTFTQEFINIYDKFVGNLADARLVITVLGNNFNFSYLEIKGVILTEGLNSYSLIFEYSEINVQESFFYVDSNNKLQFTHISNDTNTEYIQARFNIKDSTSTDASISFRSLINNNAKGFFRINYTTTSDFIPFPIVQSTTSIFLTQGNNIRDFLIIITDLDNDNVNGLTSGFIDNVKLLFLGNVQITIITLSLVGMLVPLIIILTPTVALRDLYGKSFVIPVFLLMSLIITIGEIIPIWLFFIIAISSSLFLLKENIQRDD